MGVKILIVDDETPAREELSYLLQHAEGVEQILQAKSGMEAIKLTKEIEPDLIFLDIEMPGLTGLQAAEVIQELRVKSKIIFCTAYDQHAIEAFKLRAFHYLLKPYDEANIQGILKELQMERSSAVITPQTAPLKLAIEVNGSIKYLSPLDIIFMSTEGKHVLIHAKDEIHKTNYTLYELEGKLKSFSFFRSHKSYLVNLNHIVELKAWMNGAYNLIMKDKPKSSIPVSRNYLRELRLKLEI
ncbi:LytR/AlgR family response regulator transcription factor [Paenibacillus sp. TAF58]